MADRPDLRVIDGGGLIPPNLDLDRVLELGDHPELAKLLLERLSAKGKVVYADGQLYRYDQERHLYAPVDIHEQHKIVSNLSGMPVRSGKKTKPLKLRHSDIVGTTKTAWANCADKEFFTQAPKGIMFADAFVRVTRNGIFVEQPHTDHRARVAYDFPYAPDGAPEYWLTFLEETFEGDPDAKQKIALLQEYIGASLLGFAVLFQIALILKGGGENGKDVIATILESCFPPGSTEAIPPQNWGNEYRRAKLAGKLLNIVGELPDEDILSSGPCKAIIAGTPIEGRHIRDAPFTVRSIAGQLFHVNPPMPGCTDSSHAFWRRWAILECNRRVPPERRIIDLADQIVEADRPAIVAWLIKGAQRALAAGKLTIPPSSVRAVNLWRAQADQVLGFVDELCERLDVPEAALGTHPIDPPIPREVPWGPIKAVVIGTKGSDLYSAYQRWTQVSGHKTMASNKFGARMGALGLASIKKDDANYYPVISHDERQKQQVTEGYAAAEAALIKRFKK